MSKQVNFRISDEDANKFREFCKQENYTQEIGFGMLLQVLESERAKMELSERVTEIENVQSLLKQIMSAYMGSLELAKNTETRVGEKFRFQMEKKDSEIEILNVEVDELKRENKNYVETLESIRRNESILLEKIQVLETALADKECLNKLLLEKVEMNEELNKKYTALTDEKVILERKNVELHEEIISLKDQVIDLNEKCWKKNIL